MLRNIVDNQLQQRIHAFNLGLSGEVGAGVMQVFNGGTTGGTVMTGAQAKTGSGPAINLTTLDLVTEALGISHIDLLKIDVEGHEVSVLQGATRALGFTDRVVIVYHSVGLLRELERILGRNGFRVEERIQYVPADEATGQDEVGIIYARRPS